MSSTDWSKLTETDWLSPSGLYGKYRYLLMTGRADPRRLRLFAIGCCRRIWDDMLDNRSRAAVEVAERYADNAATQEELDRANEASLEAWLEAGGSVSTREAIAAVHAAGAAAWVASREYDWCFSASTEASKAATPFVPGGDVVGPERAEQTVLLRDIFGNPFRPAKLNPSWITWNGGTGVNLATAIYEERLLPEGILDRSRVAVLADALEEAGCHDPDVLGHLRGPGPHVRGCFPVDLVLGTA